MFQLRSTLHTRGWIDTAEEMICRYVKAKVLKQQAVDEL